jgi:hypothetical protein
VNNEVNAITNINVFVLFQKSISFLRSLIIRNNRHIIAERMKITPNIKCDGVGAVSNK